MPTAQDTFIVGGVSYVVTDHDTNTGLTLDQMRSILERLNSQNGNSKINAELAGSANTQDRVVKVEVDPPGITKSFTSLGTMPGGVIDNEDIEIRIKSSDFAEGEIYRTKSGAPAQKTVDQFIAHEIGHVHDYRIRGSDLRPQLAGESDEDYRARIQRAEDYAEARENEHLKESGIRNATQSNASIRVKFFANLFRL